MTMSHKTNTIPHANKTFNAKQKENYYPKQTRKQEQKQQSNTLQQKEAKTPSSTSQLFYNMQHL